MKIFIDLDGVLYSFINAFWDELVWYHNMPESLYSEYMDNPDKYINTHLGKQLVHTPIIYERYKSVPKEKVALDKLAEIYEICYVTSRPTDVYLATKHWLTREHFPEGTIYFTSEKGKLAEELQPIFAVEDQEHHIESMRNFTNVFIMDHYYNKHVKGNRISSLEELLI